MRLEATKIAAASCCDASARDRIISFPKLSDGMHHKAGLEAAGPAPDRLDQMSLMGCKVTCREDPVE